MQYRRRRTGGVCVKCDDNDRSTKGLKIKIIQILIKISKITVSLVRGSVLFVVDNFRLICFKINVILLKLKYLTRLINSPKARNHWVRYLPDF